jgi:O-antigen/teichoic acid export membrane protein
VSNLAIALVLTPELGVEGPALATTIPFVVAYPLMLRLGLRASRVPLGELARRALAPAYLLGALLALALLGLRAGLDPRTLPAVALVAVGGVLAYWAAFYSLLLDRDERALVRGLATRAR